MIYIVVAIILILLLLWYWNPLKLEKYIHAPTMFHSWIDKSYHLQPRGTVLEPMSLAPIASKLRDAGTEFATTLQRRLGTNNAGESEHLSSSNVAVGTMLDGYYKPTSLPL